MSDKLNPFMSIESSQEYVNLLVQAIDEATVEIDENMRASILDGGGRRLEALQLVSYTLKRLREHIVTSRRLLNNLKVLRNLILGEHLLRSSAVRRPAQETAAEEAEIYI